MKKQTKPNDELRPEYDMKSLLKGGMRGKYTKRFHPSAQNVNVTDDSLIVDLSDGRTVSVPLAWFPRLLNGAPAERNKWRLIGDGEGIHWPELDEDISVENLVLGKPSGESQSSFKKWLETRSKNK